MYAHGCIKAHTMALGSLFPGCYVLRNILVLWYISGKNWTDDGWMTDGLLYNLSDGAQGPANNSGPGSDVKSMGKLHSGPTFSGVVSSVFLR